jgi:hypothetical protein
MKDFKCGDEAPLLASFDPTGKYAACWRDRMHFGRVFDSLTGECLLDLRQLTKYSGQFAWTADGKHLVYVGPDGLEVVALPSFRPKLRLQPTRAGVRKTALSR